MIFFPFSEYWWSYCAFTLIILFILAIDLGVFHKKAHAVSFKEATIWTVIWIAIALLFNWLFYFYCLWKFSNYPLNFPIAGFSPTEQARTLALEFLSGYIVEKSLAVDNIFVFALVFTYFNIPKKYQHNVLFWGIIGALVFRALFISIGSFLMQYHTILLIFGVFLILTGIKFLFVNNENTDLSKNIILKILNKFFRVYPKIESQQFFIVKNKLLYVTPLFVALIFIEISDIIFAIDSVPAIFALTKEPFIVFTSNIFAILGLRSMYFMLSSVINKFVYIKYGLAFVLIFIGFKMVYLNDAFGGKFPITWSLAIIISLIGTSIIFSLIKTRKDNKST